MNLFYNARVCYWPWDINVSPAQAEKTARYFTEKAVNVLMLNHDHFRWNFVTLFPEIEKATKIVVDACHREGISVIEHHSSTITSNPGFYKKRKMKDWANRDVRTGKPGYIQVSHPGEEQNISWWCCINNPHWKESYYHYITDFFKTTGVDGLMHDDIHFAPGWFYCGCRYCRAKFKKIFGYSLPTGKNQPVWENFASPVWRDWLMFRRISCGDEFADISKVLGPDKVLFGCCSIALNSTLGAHDAGYVYEDYARGANVLYMESCYHPRNEAPLLQYFFYNYKRHFLDRKYYQALSEARGLPVAAYYYPASPQESFFCWALTKMFGQGYIVYPEHYDYSEYTGTKEKDKIEYFGWEKKYEYLFKDTKTLAATGILYSSVTMTFAGEDSRYYLDELRGWTEVMTEENLPFKIIMADTNFTIEKLKGLNLLILADVACLSTAQLRIIKKFVKNGGNLIVTYETSMCDEQGARRKNFGLKDILQFDYERTVQGINLPVYPVTQHKDNPVLNGCGERIPYNGPQVQGNFHGEFTDILAWMEKYNLFAIRAPHPAVITGKYGKGRFLYFSFKPGLMCATEGICPVIKKDYREKFIAQKKNPAPPLWVDERVPVYKKILLNSIRTLVPEQNHPVSPVNMPKGVLMNSFVLRDKSIVIGLLNLSGAELVTNRQIPYKYRVTYPEIKEPVQIRINLGSVGKISLISPDFDGEKQIKAVHGTAGGYVLNIPPDFLKKVLFLHVK